ncbi:MAG: class I SAM-dependent methyltransferase, partial [Candidatus Heimdallarchaeota archaeon]
MRITSDPGSYKDPSGGVFYYKDKVCRWVADDTNQFYQNLVKSNLFQDLIQSKYFVPTSQIDLNHDECISNQYGNNATYFEHERIQFISFPYEWPPSMILDAAIHTLDLQSMLLQKNLSLKDATPYNIQYRHAQPLFIDLCSIQNASENGIWIAYNQFCQTFLYPLLTFQFTSSSLRSIYLTHLDGLTLDETFESLGFRPVWKHGLIFDYVMPAFLRKIENSSLPISKKTVSTSRTFKNSSEIQLYTVRRLRRVFNRMRLGTGTSKWKNYRKSCSYTDENYLRKKEFIESVLRSHHINNVLDLGCNTGDISLLAAKNGVDVVALDSDPYCVDHLYRRSKDHHAPILSLCIDIANPSPSIGWFNRERPSFLERVNRQFDCVFALALIHHLLIKNRIPLPQIVDLLRHCTSRFLVVEFVGPSDKMFQELLRYRTESYSDFNRGNFEATMSQHFSIIRNEEIVDPVRAMDRCLYLMECK